MIEIGEYKHQSFLVQGAGFVQVPTHENLRPF